MHQINRDILIELNQNKQKNYLYSPIWIIKGESVFYKGNYFLKLFLYKKPYLNEEILGVSLLVKSVDSERILDVFEFKKVESYKEESVFGVLLQIPTEFEITKIDYRLIRYYNSRGEVKTDQGNYDAINLTPEQVNEQYNNYLRENLNYSLFPVIHGDYWHCFCGEVNDQSYSDCQNCRSSKSDVENVIQRGRDRLIFDHLYLNNKVFKTKTEQSIIQQNAFLSNYIKLFTDQGISHNNAVEWLNEVDFVKTYVENYPIIINSKVDVNQNIIDYFEPLKEQGFYVSEISSYISVDEVKKEIEKIESKKKRDKKILVFASIVMVLIISLYNFVLKDAIENYQAQQRYELLYSDYEKMLNSGEIIESCNQAFPEMNNSLDLMEKCNKIRDAQLYENAISNIYQKKYSEAKSILQKITNHKNSKELISAIDCLSTAKNKIRQDLFLFYDEQIHGNDCFNQIITFFNDYPIGLADEYLVNAKYLDRILGSDIWKTSNGDNYFYISNGLLTTNIPNDAEKNSGNTLKSRSPYFEPYSSMYIDVRPSNETGIILYKGVNAHYYLAYQYKIIDLNTIEIVSNRNDRVYRLIKQK